MKTLKRATPIVLAGIVGFVASPGMASEAPRQVAQASASAATQAMPVYRPPLRGAPGGRVGGGTRGTAARDVFVLSALAPDHSGLTVSEQPTLYWFISGDTSLPVEFAIIDPGGVEPLVETALKSPVKRGVHQIRLADYGVKLSTGVAYRWSVTVVPDANRRSRDILASGVLERVAPSEALRAKVSTVPKDQLAFVYAESGIWYDALAAISELIASTPGDATLQRQRAALLSQAGLPSISDPGGP
jgi:hypothetical protein